MNEACHIWMRHVTFMNESCHIYECVTSQVRTSCVSHQYERLTYLWGMSQMLMRCAAFMKGTCYVHACHVPTSEGVCMSHITSMDVTCDTHEYEERVVLCFWTGRVTCMRVMSHVQAHVTWCHTCEWVTPHVWMCHFTRINRAALCHAYKCVMSHIWIRHGTHMKEASHTYEWVISHKLTPVPGSRRRHCM